MAKKNQVINTMENDEDLGEYRKVQYPTPGEPEGPRGGESNTRRILRRAKNGKSSVGVWIGGTGPSGGFN